MLVAAARVDMRSDDRIAARGAIERGLDWETVLSLAEQHGLIPLLAHHVASGAVDSATIPTDALATLKQQAARSTYWSLYLAAELVRLLRELATCGIHAVPLKGPVLAQTVYGSVALRRFGDLDILIAKADLQKTIALFETRGYRLDGAHDAAGEQQLLDMQHHVSMIDPSRRYRVEIHYYLIPPLGATRYGMSAIADELETIAFLDTHVTVLRPEGLLVYLCMHGTGHAWERLEWICGVAELVRSGRVRDWERVCRFATRLGGVRQLNAGVLIAHQLLGAPLPEALGKCDRHAERAAGVIIERILDNPAFQPSSGNAPMTLFMYRVRTDGGVFAQVRRLGVTLFSPHMADVRAVALPRFLWPLYSLIRPVRLLLRQGLRLANRSD